MEIAFFRAGITRTASDQSISMGTASESLATALAMSSSVSASTRAQSVLPFLGVSLETVVIFFSLVAPRPPGRDDPAERAPDRTGDRDFPPFNVPKDLIPDFAMTIRSADECVAVENSAYVLEVDPMISQVTFALFRIPSEVTNACEQPLYVFRHSKSPQARVSTRITPLEVRYDGFEALLPNLAVVVVLTPAQASLPKARTSSTARIYICICGVNPCHSGFAPRGAPPE